MKIVALALTPLVLVLASVLGLVVVLGPADGPSYDCATPPGTVLPVSATDEHFDAEQLANARTIIAVGKAANVPAYGWVIALATAMQESGLRNLPYGDRDSLGLFQQRPSMGWGTPAQVMDPVYASTKFFERLVAVPGWLSMPVTRAAQAVQRSGLPDAYADREAAARRLVERLAPEVDVALLVTTDNCFVGTEGPVVVPLPPGTYRDEHNYGGTSAHWAATHTGDDLAAPCGTPVLAATAGVVVIESGSGWTWSGRWLVKIQTAPGALTTWYGHMQVLTVNPGQRVQAGQQIGEVGSLGNATGCHLHFEVHPHGGGYLEDQIDPAAWLAANVGKPGHAPSGGFRVATFNVLGSSHTGPGGDQHAGWSSGTERIVAAIDLLDARGVSVAGLQEFESPQYRVFHRRYAGRWAAWFAGGDSRNAVIWRTDTWKLVSARSFPIPYINGTDEMPVVLLRNLATGTQLYVVNVHNPSNMYGTFAHQRSQALRIESGVVDQLLVTETPLLLTGDFNATDEPVCTFTPRLANAFGSSQGRCGAQRGESIDHIFGGRLAFDDTRSDGTPKRERISDHDLVLTTVSTTT